VKKLNFVAALGLLCSTMVHAAPTVPKTFSSVAENTYVFDIGSSVDTSTHWFVFDVRSDITPTSFIVTDAYDANNFKVQMQAYLFKGNVTGLDFVKAGATPDNFQGNAADFFETHLPNEQKKFSYLNEYSISEITGMYQPYLNKSLEKGIYSFAVSTFDGVSTTYKFNTNAIPYSVSAVPEPESYAMLIAGLGVLGLLMRRKIKNQSKGFAKPSSWVPA
jgi:hypothetical protein